MHSCRPRLLVFFTILSINVYKMETRALVHVTLLLISLWLKLTNTHKIAEFDGTSNVYHSKLWIMWMCDSWVKFVHVCFFTFQGEVELSIPRFNVDFPTVLCRAPYSWYIKSKDYIIAKLSVWYHSVDTAICLYVDQ